MFENIGSGIIRAAGLAFLVGSVMAVSHAVDADGMNNETELFTILRGGQIYDNWVSVTEADKPTATHPSYPKAGKKKGAATWRCKECHGWDYRGAEGAYAKGSHYTGLKGVRTWVGKDPDAIAKVVRNKVHGYTKAMLSDNAVAKVSLFLSRGQVDMDQYIDRSTKKAHGDANRGARFYQTVCAICHGFDGREINFKDDPKIEYIGTVAAANPWETLHKIRNGQPGVAMPALGALSIQDQVDILAYTQTLPTK